MREYPLASSYDGQLNKINNCWIYIPGSNDGAAPNTGSGMLIEFLSMPVISDGKGAKYDAAPVIGRSTPILTYASSEVRQISLDLLFITIKTSGSDIGSLTYNAKALRAIASASYPGVGKTGMYPYNPPPICIIKFGSFLWEDNENNQGVCAVLDKYSVKNDPAVPSDPETLIPYKFTVTTNWSLVYSSDDLPTSERIFVSGK